MRGEDYKPDKDYKITDCGKPSIFVGERLSLALVHLIEFTIRHVTEEQRIVLCTFLHNSQQALKDGQIDADG